MQDKHDPVDHALESLGGRHWPEDYDNNKLKDKIMKDFNTNSASRFSRRTTLAATLAVVLLGTAGFAAAGGLKMVQSWFVTLEINGESVAVELVEVDVQQDGELISITLDENDLGDIDAEPGDVITVTAVSGGLQQVEVVNDPDGKIKEALETNSKVKKDDE